MLLTVHSGNTVVALHLFSSYGKQTGVHRSATKEIQALTDKEGSALPQNGSRCVRSTLAPHFLWDTYNYRWPSIRSCSHHFFPLIKGLN